MNKVMLAGNVGKDPLKAVTPNGRAVARFDLATKEVWTADNGDKREQTTWHHITAWGPKADIVMKHITKGRLIGIEGKIRNYSYTKNDQTFYASEVVAQNIQFLDKAPRGPAEFQAPPVEEANPPYGEDAYEEPAF